MADAHKNVEQQQKNSWRWTKKFW